MDCVNDFAGSSVGAAGATCSYASSASLALLCAATDATGQIAIAMTKIGHVSDEGRTYLFCLVLINGNLVCERVSKQI